MSRADVWRKVHYVGKVDRPGDFAQGGLQRFAARVCVVANEESLFVARRELLVAAPACTVFGRKTNTQPVQT
jgi:hypothetical protein